MPRNIISRCSIIAVLLVSALSRAVMGSLGQPTSPTELRVWLNIADRGLEATFRAYERAHPDVRIVSAIYKEGSDSQKLMTAIAGGEPPDIVLQDRFSVGEWAARDAFLPLDSRIRNSPIRPSDFYEACWSEATYAGEVYGIPWSSDARALYYNEDLLRRAGFVNAGGNVVPPRDWDELRAYAKKLTERGADGQIRVLGFSPTFGDAWLYLYGFLNGGEFMSRDGTRVTLDDPRIVEALAFMRAIYDDAGGVNEVDAFTNGTTGLDIDLFATGKVAMKIDGDWSLNTLTEYFPNMRFGVAPPPAPKGRASVTWAGGHAYCIPATSRNADEAFALICFLVSDAGWRIHHDVNHQYANGRGLVYVPRMTAQPAVNEAERVRLVDGNPNVPSRVAAAIPVFARLMHVARFRPVSPIGQLLWDEQNRATDLAFRTHGDPAQALADAGRRVQVNLDRVLDRSPHSRVNVGNIAVCITVAISIACIIAIAFSLRRQRDVGRVISRRDERLTAFVFVAPWAIGFIVFTAGPIIASLIYSFCRYDALHAPEWIGLENVRRLAGDPMFWRSLGNTAYMLIGVPLGMSAGLAIAVLLSADVRGVKVVRTLVYLPSIVPIVASSILWMWVLNPTSGLINNVLRMIGIRDLPLWLASPSLLLGSKASILLMGLWGVGGSMVIWIAGLKGIPQHLYEAAEIDGAGPLRRFVHVTLPMLSPYIFFNLVMGTIGTMQIFTQAFVMTGGGPADSTLFYAYHLFNSAFRYFEMGYASAMAWIMLLIILALTAIEMWTSRRWVQYEQA